jgi:L-aminopeptidase/D-esterase-like protein
VATTDADKSEDGEVIEGFEIGHHTADTDGWLTGTTVVLARAGAVGGVDVRGGGPGTRETDLLDPRNLVERVNAVVLTGGSAYGLAAADGVMAALERDGVGFPVGPEPGQVVPIVPAAVIFDLGRGGYFGHRPTADFGLRAYAAASAERPESGVVGAGTGAQCGGLKGGFGYAERWLDDGTGVGAAVAVNATGSPVDPVTGRLWADREQRLAAPTPAERTALATAYAHAQPSLATTIGVLLTDATLTKAQASRLATIGHDGMARAIAPVHSMLDGDTVFALASGRRPATDDPRQGLIAFNRLLSAAADTFTDACLDALLAAQGRGLWPAYRDLAPTTLR